MWSRFEERVVFAEFVMSYRDSLCLKVCLTSHRFSHFVLHCLVPLPTDSPLGERGDVLCHSHCMLLNGLQQFTPNWKHHTCIMWWAATKLYSLGQQRTCSGQLMYFGLRRYTLRNCMSVLFACFSILQGSLVSVAWHPWQGSTHLPRAVPMNVCTAHAAALALYLAVFVKSWLRPKPLAFSCQGQVTAISPSRGSLNGPGARVRKWHKLRALSGLGLHWGHW